MKILIYPFSITNPYQKLVISELELYNHEIFTEPPKFKKSQFFLIKIMRDIDVLNLHWFSFCYEGKIFISFFIKTISFIIVLAILRFKKKRIVLTLHNLIPHDTRKKKLHLLARYFILKVVNKVIVFNDDAKKIVSKKLKCKKKIEIIPHISYINHYLNNTTKLTSRKKLNIQINSKVLLFFGSLRHYKGIEQVISFFNEMGEDYVLLIAGKGDSEYTNILKTIANKKNIIFYDKYIYDNDVQYFFNASDLFILPSHNCLHSGSAVLSINFNKPIIGTDITALKELNRLGISYFYEPKNILTFKNAINKLLGLDKKILYKKCRIYNDKIDPKKIGYLYNEILKS